MPRATRRAIAPAVLALAALAGVAAVLPAQGPVAPGDVRQVVTFLFQPGALPQGLAIYADRLRPIYADVPALRRFRAYREVESPEPLDLVVVSHYAGMAGMDSANAALRRPHTSGESAFALYGALSALLQHHHDQFVEMRPAVSDSLPDARGLTVLEYVRLVPGAHARYEARLASHGRPLERRLPLLGSETGRLLVADGWDYLRFHVVRSLGDWHAVERARWAAEPALGLAPLVAGRKVILLRADPTLGVR
jgi:hypothetical protein